MTKSKNRRRYDEQFKQDAVNLVIHGGRTCSQVEKDLGIGQGMVARWVSEAVLRADAQYPDAEQRPSELVKEIQQLRRQLADTQMNRDILKKALSILSQPHSNIKAR